MDYSYLIAVYSYTIIGSANPRLGRPPPQRMPYPPPTTNASSPSPTKQRTPARCSQADAVYQQEALARSLVAVAHPAKLIPPIICQTAILESGSEDVSDDFVM